jgi:hypothetical protein
MFKTSGAGIRWKRCFWGMVCLAVLLLSFSGVILDVQALAVKPQGGDGGGNGGGGGNSGGDSHSPGGDQTRENTNLCGSAALALGGVGLLLLNRRVKRQNRQADR